MLPFAPIKYRKSEATMGKKIYDAIMLIVAICMLIIAYLTYVATKTRADVVQPSYEVATEITEGDPADR